MAKRNPIPPCPGNPEDYILIKTREGYHWRKKKRGTKLNASLQNNMKLTALISPVASTIRKKLLPFLDWLDTGRFVANVSGMLKKEYNNTGKLDFLALKGYDLQPYFPLDKLLRGGYQLSVKKNEAIIEILLFENVVKANNKLVTGYYFEAILMYGDLAKPDSLRIDSDTSPVYEIRSKTKTMCRLSVILPSKKVSWMLMLKLSSVYGNEPADYRKHYGMKIVWAERS